MIHLTPNSGTNDIYVSPYQSRKFLASFTYYLLVLENQATAASFSCVVNWSEDNERYNRARLPTNNDDPVTVPFTTLTSHKPRLV